MEINKIAAVIREALTMDDMIAQYIKVKPRRNRIPCPIHNGDNYNMSFNEHGYHCFVCGSSGGVIKFVEHIFNIDFPTAVRKINMDFNMNLPIDRPPTLSEAVNITSFFEKKQAERAAREAEEQRRLDRFGELNGLWAKYDKTIRELSPATLSEVDPRYIEALNNIDYIEYLLDEEFLGKRCHADERTIHGQNSAI